MPLIQTDYGGVCPLGKFHLDVAGGCGGYDIDPVEACIKCNFSDLEQEGFDLEKICQCPSDLSWDEYNSLRKSYSNTGSNLTKEGFWDFVNKNRLVKLRS